MKGKKWTEKQLKEKIKEIKSRIRFNQRTIKKSEEEIRDLEILLKHFEECLAEKYNNPTSKRFGATS